MFRNVLAVVVGIVVAVILILIVETAGHAVYPPPGNLELADRDAMSAYIDAVPTGALLFVMGAWLAGTLGGGVLACFIAKDRPHVYAGAVGGTVLLGTAITLIRIPHPTWFSVISVSAIILTACLAGRIGRKFVQARNDA